MHTRQLIFALLAASVALAELPPMEQYLRSAINKPTGPITDDDIISTFAVEARPQDMPYITQTMSKNVIRWYRQIEQNGFPTLTASPEQIHITVTETSENVTVLWTTSTASNASSVCWWPSGNAPKKQCAAGTAWTYNPISIVPWVGTLHGAHMVGLIPADQYCYQVGDPVIDVWSNVTCFAAPNLKSNKITVALGGDMGSVQLFGYLVADQMYYDNTVNNISFDAFWLLGDIAYSTLDPGHQANGEFFWDIFMRQEAPLVDHVPFLVTYGNHDYDGGDSGAFINRFRNPQGGKGYNNFYWSYTHGPVKFVSMCTELWLEPTICDYSPGSAQYKWLEEQFANINRTETPWLILGGHRPMYSSDRSTDSGPLKQYIEPLLQRYQVDVQLTGHMHETELCAPVYNDTVNMTGVSQTGDVSWTYLNPQGTVHITTGILGALQDENFRDPRPAWSLYFNGTVFDDAYGYVTMQALPGHLYFEALRQRDGSTMWSLSIHKSL